MSDQDWPATPPRKILLATDLSSRGDRALDRAAQLARQWSAQLLVVHVIEPNTGAGALPVETEMVAWRRSPDRSAIISRMIKHDLGDETLDVKIVIEEAEPAAFILELVERERCDLVVLGMARDELFRPMLLGSTAEQIVRACPVGVLVVKARPRGPYRHVLVGTDFTEESRYALRASVELFPEATFLVMHAFERPYRLLLPDSQPVHDFAAMELATMREFVGATELPGEMRARIHTSVEHGPPGAMLSRYVVERGADLTVIGAFKRGLVFHVVIGGTARRIVDAVPTDVLVIRAKRDAGS